MLLHCCGRLILSVLGTRTLGITLATAQSKEAEPRPWGGGLGCEPQWTPRICCPAPRLLQVGFLQPTCPAFQEAELGPGHRDPRTSWDPECCLSASSSPGALSMGTSFLQGCGNFLKFIYFKLEDNCFTALISAICQHELATGTQMCPP